MMDHCFHCPSADDEKLVIVVCIGREGSGARGACRAWGYKL